MKQTFCLKQCKPKKLRNKEIKQETEERRKEIRKKGKRKRKKKTTEGKKKQETEIYQ